LFVVGSLFAIGCGSPTTKPASSPSTPKPDPTKMKEKAGDMDKDKTTKPGDMDKDKTTKPGDTDKDKTTPKDKDKGPTLAPTDKDKVTPKDKDKDKKDK
jgi:hypothetical protein